MPSDSNAADDWAAAMQKAQADLFRQWAEFGQAALRAGAIPAAPAAAPQDMTTTLVRQFMQQCEQYLGVSQSLWDLVTRATAVTDADQRTRYFSDGISALQQQFAHMWAAGTLGTPSAGGLGVPGWPGAALFGSFAPGAPGFAGMGAAPGMGAVPNMGMPALGPAREQQEAWQRLMQLSMRCAHAQMQLSVQWNDIIGKALRELAERLAPRLRSGATPTSMKEIYDLWVDAAESVYAQAARAGAFVQAQAELTNATSQLRVAQRELLEEWARQYDLPTRSELNSIHQQLRDLKAALAAGKPS